jgi:hypothetical protein
LASWLAASFGRVTPPPPGVVRVPKILHKNAYALKKWKFTQIDETKLEQTHPRADNRFP